MINQRDYHRPLTAETVAEKRRHLVGLLDVMLIRESPNAKFVRDLSCQFFQFVKLSADQCHMKSPGGGFPGQGGTKSR